jgi:hypothetical protein
MLTPFWIEEIISISPTTCNLKHWCQFDLTPFKVLLVTQKVISKRYWLNHDSALETVALSLVLYQQELAVAVTAPSTPKSFFFNPAQFSEASPKTLSKFQNLKIC